MSEAKKVMMKEIRLVVARQKGSHVISRFYYDFETMGDLGLYKNLQTDYDVLFEMRHFIPCAVLDAYRVAVRNEQDTLGELGPLADLASFFLDAGAELQESFVQNGHNVQ